MLCLPEIWVSVSSLERPGQSYDDNYQSDNNDGPYRNAVALTLLGEPPLICSPFSPTHISSLSRAQEWGEDTVYGSSLTRPSYLI